MKRMNTTTHGSVERKCKACDAPVGMVSTNSKHTVYECMLCFKRSKVKTELLTK